MNSANYTLYIASKVRKPLFVQIFVQRMIIYLSITWVQVLGGQGIFLKVQGISSKRIVFLKIE